MTEADEADFIGFAGGTCDLQIIRNASTDPTAMLVGQPIPHDELLLSLTCVEFLPNLKMSYVAQSGLHIVEFIDSEVVQFSRCQMTSDGSRLKSGRLWFEPKSAGGPKSVTFARWAERLIAYIRRSYEPDADRRYVGPDAARQRDTGRIELGMPTKGLTRDEALKKLGLG